MKGSNSWKDTEQPDSYTNFINTKWKCHPNKHSKRRRKHTNAQSHVCIKSVSCNLSPIKLLISVRVVLWSLSTLLHLHKIKDARFLCHCLPIERNRFPQRDDLGPLWPTRGRSINTQLERLVSQRLEGTPWIKVSSPWITLCCIMPRKSWEITQERGGKQRMSWISSCRRVPDLSSINQCCLGL